ncbi:Peptidase M20 domain-containing protein 2 [Fulvia fulva]|uniref:Peptidase M20 domain-containing protein 2 n=1 Tax=Passalora fulva TaxID=5499 RepID=A0A9Q8LCU9_PASFU|nr:Peptidase M20 domain-containing protein 2 [Fulvia fulva]KAK4629930.1 Peptidase M20 domain-containing protein 2 [Fulvia fulva]UJO15140.1 Peptidase M20 domain-containing protein 2 [Fulvia fulva]WPV12034.1 Peptidase M20 domain-containing protein 2 [Fulvia fulva]
MNMESHTLLPSSAVMQKAMHEYIQGLNPKLRALNLFIHSNPELAYQEHKAHDAICDFLDELGYSVRRHAYGLATAFEVMSGTGRRTVNFNAEYDALPDIGHACGHNLIATAAVTGFIALSHVLKHFNIEGRVQLLGTPAEEDGGGKIDLLKAGAYEHVDVSLMVHPMSDADYTPQGVLGSAGFLSGTSYSLLGTYTGVGAHAGASPWEGVNALDAVVSAYNNVSMLRQQIRPAERIHGAIVGAPKANSNAIPALTKIEYTARSTTIRAAKNLADRVGRCMKAGAMATGCKLKIEEKPGYADLRMNQPLCGMFQQYMDSNGIRILESEGYIAAATDQGNVSYALPALHGVIGIPVEDGFKNHTPGFTKAAGTMEAHNRIVISGKAMAMTGWEVLSDDRLYQMAKNAFEKDKASR